MIPEQHTYLVVNLLAISIPLLHSLHKKSHFYGKWKSLLPAIGVTSAFFLAWDVIFTKMGIWSFNSNLFIGLEILGLPFEEYLFFICIPFACVFTYEFFNQKLSKYNAFIEKAGNVFSYLLIALFIGVLFIAHDRLYTTVTAIFFIAFILYMQNSPFSKHSGMVYLSYIPLLLPFFFVNGTLTGSFTSEPVVLYNNLENLGIRWGTIPIEDAFYGLFLIQANILLFEYFKLYSATNKKWQLPRFFSITKPVKS